MKLRVAIDEVIRIVADELEEHHIHSDHHLSSPRWLTDHGPHDGGIGEAYDVPHFLEFDMLLPNEEVKDADSST